MPEIYFNPDEVWEYICLINKPGTSEEIASNEDTGIIIYVTIDDGISIVVEEDYMPIQEREVVDAIDCENTVKELYDFFLDSSYVGESEKDEQIDLIMDREDELDSLIFDFYIGVCGDAPYFDVSRNEEKEILSDLKEHFLEYMAEKHKIPVYRPMFLEDDKGTFFEEYPYEHMVFEKTK